MTIAGAWPDPWFLGVPPVACGPPASIDLAGSEGPHGCAPMAARRALEAVRQSRPDEVEAREQLRMAVSRRHSVTADRITLAAGCRMLLPALLRGLFHDEKGATPSRPVLAMPSGPPPLHRLAALQAGLEWVDLPRRDDAPWLENWTEILESGRVGVLLVGHPANPTGAVLARNELRELLEAAARSGARVVVDEAYADYAGNEVLRSAAMLDDFPHLVVLRSFSSLYGLGILPAAYALASPDLISRVAGMLTGAAPGYVAARAAEGALQEPSFERVVVDRVGRSRFRMAQELTTLGVTVLSGHGPWIVMEGARGGGFVERLAARGIRVRDLAPWGFEGSMRVRAGGEDEVESFLKVAREVFRR